MALDIKNISTGLVAQTIGAGSNDVGTLCNHPNINKWSKFKPIIYGSSVQSTNGILPYKSGLMVKHDTKSKIGHSLYYYIQVTLDNILLLESNLDANGNPVLTADDLYGDLEYRLGDFRGYDHNAKKPSFEENPLGLTVAPGERENTSLTLMLDSASLDVIKSILATDTPYDEVSTIDRFVFGGSWFNYNQLHAMSFLKVDIDSYSTTGYNAIFPFEQEANQILAYQIPHFTSSIQTSHKIYLDKEDALLNGEKEYNFIRTIEIPAYFNKYLSDGSKNFTRFRDVPLKPIISGIPNLIIRNFRLFCQVEDEMGIPPHYTVFLNADGDFRGEYIVKIKFEVYEMDWASKTIGNLVGSTNYTNDGLANYTGTTEVPQNVATSLYIDSGVYGENSFFFHLPTPLTAGNIPIDNVGNSGVTNYNLINNRLNNYAIKTFIDFTHS